jgi:hypothetical protein
MKTFLPLVHSIVFVCMTIALVVITIPSSIVSARPPLDATPVSSDFKNPKTLKDPCEKQSNNLITNGGMGPDRHDVAQYGSIADGWTPFIFSGSLPQFRVVDNEGVDGVSQQVYSTDIFDAGVLQTISGLQPGVQYWVRWGDSLAAKSGGSYGVPNVRVDSIGRKIGVDPFGGTDPKSANIVWGPDLFDGNAALNVLQMIWLGPARADHVTVFLRAIAREGGNGENRVWIDALCMEARTDLPVAVPLPPASPTLTLAPTARATFTRIPPTRVLPTRTPGRSPTPSPSPSPTAATPTQTLVRAPATVTLAPALPVRARRAVTAAEASIFDLDSETLVNIGYGSIGGSVFFFLMGFVLVRRAFR